MKKEKETRKKYEKQKSRINFTILWDYKDDWGIIRPLWLISPDFSNIGTALQWAGRELRNKKYVVYIEYQVFEIILKNEEGIPLVDKWFTKDSQILNFNKETKKWDEINEVMKKRIKEWKEYLKIKYPFKSQQHKTRGSII